MNAAATSASVAAVDTTGGRQQSTIKPDDSKTQVVTYEWQAEAGAPTPPVTRWMVSWTPTFTGTTTAHIDDGATGSGESVAFIQVNSSGVNAAEFADENGIVTSYPQEGELAASEQAIYVSYPNGIPTLRFNATVTISGYSSHSSSGWVETRVTPRGGGNPPPDVVHNLAPGHAETSAASASTPGDFTIVAA